MQQEIYSKRNENKMFKHTVGIQMKKVLNLKMRNMKKRVSKKSLREKNKDFVFIF